MKNNSNILWSSIASVLLLICFFLMQWSESPLLDLDFKWVAVAGVPLLIGLLYSGIIKNFKGFGIELETHFSDTMKQIEIIGELRPLKSPGMSKDNLQRLFEMEEIEKSKIERLIFENGKQGYYNESIVSEYFHALPNLKFIEVKEKDGHFNCLIPISTLLDTENNVDWENLRKFINSIENRTVESNFPNTVSIYLSEDNSLLKAYKAISTSKGLQVDGDNILPVVNKSQELIGLVSKKKLEERISEQVLDLTENK